MPELMMELETKVVGVTFNNGDGLSRQHILEDILDELTHHGPFELIALRDNDNPYDCNAIAILDPKWRQIGFINKRLAAELAPLLAEHGEDLQLSCTAEEVTGLDHESNYGLNIRLRYQDPSP
jgi:hypothetical protein